MYEKKKKKPYYVWKSNILLVQRWYGKGGNDNNREQ